MGVFSKDFHLALVPFTHVVTFKPILRVLIQSLDIEYIEDEREK
jgi:hypothetical protein